MSRNESTAEESRINDFLLARGGPFYELQRQLGLLREDAFRAGPRAALFVALAWGVPLLLSLVSGSALGIRTESPYLLELNVWTRFFVAVGLFLLMERQIEERLRMLLLQFVRAPLLAPGSFKAAAVAVTRALKRRDARLAELLCLLLALLPSFATFYRFIDQETASWAASVSPEGNSLTAAGWWVVAVSNPLFWFLLLRWLWRLFVWSMLLRDLSRLDLRLVSTHPDGHGGLAFLGEYPNTFSTYVFAISCVLGAAIAHEFLHAGLTPTSYGYVMASWLLIVLMLFTFPLLAFGKPLTELKKQTLLFAGSRATQHLRAAERETLGRNISVDGDDADIVAASDVPDPSKLFAATGKLSTMLISRAGLLPVSTAALLPLVAAGATQLPIKEILGVMKRLLLL